MFCFSRKLLTLISCETSSRTYLCSTSPWHTYNKIFNDFFSYSASFLLLRIFLQLIQYDWSIYPFDNHFWELSRRFFVGIISDKFANISILMIWVLSNTLCGLVFSLPKTNCNLFQDAKGSTIGKIMSSWYFWPATDLFQQETSSICPPLKKFHTINNSSLKRTREIIQSSLQLLSHLFHSFTLPSW